VRFYRPTDATDTRDQPREAPSQRQSRPVRKGLTGRKKGARALDRSVRHKQRRAAMLLINETQQYH
jgi:hypothetical protein